MSIGTSNLYESCGTVRLVSVRGHGVSVEKCVRQFGGGTC
jgi:hypothetical protein